MGKRLWRFSIRTVMMTLKILWLKWWSRYMKKQKQSSLFNSIFYQVFNTWRYYAMCQSLFLVNCPSPDFLPSVASITINHKLFRSCFMHVWWQIIITLTHHQHYTELAGFCGRILSKEKLSPILSAYGLS